MASFSKWIGGALGWALFGPIGALMGLVFGSLVDSVIPDEKIGKASQKKFRHKTHSGDFASSLLILSAAVMKADKRYLKSELNFIRNYFEDMYGQEKTVMHMTTLKSLLKQNIPVRDVCAQIRYFMEHSNRLQMLYYLFGIANADGEIHESENKLLYDIAKYLGISYADYESIQAMFRTDDRSRNYSGNGRKSAPARPSKYMHNPYKILEIESSASDQEVKKAYRKMARKYHPDKVSNLGEAHMKKAQEKFIEVDKAYDEIKRRRNN